MPSAATAVQGASQTMQVLGICILVAKKNTTPFGCHDSDAEHSQIK